MSQKIVNLTWLVVIKEIEFTLEEYPQYPYQVAFSMDELRQKLIAHVLSNVPNRYIVIDEAQEPFIDNKCLQGSLEEQMRIETLIRGSIFHILRENADWVSRHIPQIDNSVN